MVNITHLHYNSVKVYIEDKYQLSQGQTILKLEYFKIVKYSNFINSRGDKCGHPGPMKAITHLGSFRHMHFDNVWC